MANIFFFLNEIEATIDDESLLKEWLVASAAEEGRQIGDLNVILCSDEYLLEMNQKYLNHDTYTDIITFDHSDEELISGELYISFDRVLENSEKRSIPHQKELKRVLIHGLLHLMGFGDKSSEEKTVMRAKEDYFLSKF